MWIEVFYLHFVLFIFEFIFCISVCAEWITITISHLSYHIISNFPIALHRYSSQMHDKLMKQFNQTSLHLAAMMGHSEVCKLLLAGKADCSITDTIVSYRGCWHLFRFQYYHHASINFRQYNYCTLNLSGDWELEYIYIVFSPLSMKLRMFICSCIIGANETLEIIVSFSNNCLIYWYLPVLYTLERRYPSWYRCPCGPYRSV